MFLRATTIDILTRQLCGSKVLLLILFTILGISTISEVIGLANWLIDYLMFISLYFLILLIGIALITAVHEGGHLSQMKELGFELKRLVVNRIGNVSFSVDNSNNLQFEDQYVIAVDHISTRNNTSQSYLCYFVY